MNRTLPLLSLFLLLAVAHPGICQNYLPEYLYSNPDLSFNDVKLNTSKEICLYAQNQSVSGDVLIRLDKTGKKLWEMDFPAYSIGYYDIADNGNVNVISSENGVYSIYKILADGNLAGVPKTFTGPWNNSKIVMDKTGNVYVLWRSPEDYLYVSKYDQNGILAWPPAYMGYAGLSSDITINNDGQVFVANATPDLFVFLKYNLEVLKLGPNGILSGDEILETKSYTWDTFELQYVSIYVDVAGNLVVINAYDPNRDYEINPTTSFFIVDPESLDVVTHHTIPFGPTARLPIKVNVMGPTKFIAGQIDEDSYRKIRLVKISEDHTYSFVTDSLNLPEVPMVFSLPVDPGGNLSAVGIFPQQTSARIYLANYSSQGTATGQFRYFGNQASAYSSAPSVFDFENNLLVPVKGDLIKFTPCSKVPFTIASEPASVEVCAGSDSKLEVNVSGKELSFYWYKGANLLGPSTKFVGTNTGSLIIKKADILDAGTYYCEIKDACGRILKTKSAVVSVTATPSFTSGKPEDLSRCVGGEAIFQITATGGKNLKYQWKKGQTSLTETANVVGTKTGKLTIKAVAAGDIGEYYCEVTDDCSAVVLVSQKATLGIQSPTNITKHPESIQSCIDGTASLSVNATGTNLTYQWRRGAVNLADGTRYSGAKSSTLTLSSLQISDAGEYTCVVTGGCGAAQVSSKGVLTVNTNQQITSHPQNKSICSGATVTFSITASTGGVTYQWVKGNTNLVNNSRTSGVTTSSITIQSATTADAGTYACIVTTSCGNKLTSNVAQLQIGAMPSITAKSADQLLCEGALAKFSITTNVIAGNFQWKKDGTPLTDGPTIAGSQTPELFVNDVGPSNAGNYTCEVTTGCGQPQSSGIIKLQVKEKVAITLQPVGAMFCDGDKVVLSVSATGSSPVYQWKKDGTIIANNQRTAGATSPTLTINGATAFEEGDYTCEVTGCDGVVASHSVFVQVNSKPKLILQELYCDSPVSDWSSLVDDENNTFGNFLLFKQGSTNPLPSLNSIDEMGVYFIVKQTKNCADTIQWNNQCLITAVETGNTHNVSVYPNPTSRWIYIHYDPAQLTEFELLDAHGRKICSGILEPTGETLIDGDILSGGVYAVRLKSTKGKTIFERLIVKR